MSEKLTSILGIQNEQMAFYFRNTSSEYINMQFAALQELVNVSPTTEDLSLEFKSGKVGIALKVSEDIFILLLLDSISKVYQLRSRWFNHQDELKQIILSLVNRGETQNEVSEALRSIVHHCSILGQKGSNSILINEVHRGKHILALVYHKASIELSNDMVNKIRYEFNTEFKDSSTSIGRIQALQPGDFSIAILELDSQTDEVTFVSAGLPFLFKNASTYYKIKSANYSKSNVSKYEATLNKGDEVYMMNVPSGDGSKSQRAALTSIQKSLMGRNSSVSFKNLNQQLDSVLTELPTDFLMIGMQV